MMRRLQGLPGLLSVAALVVGIGAAQAASVGTTENTQYAAVWLADAQGRRGEGAPALLNVPPGWGGGDAAAVIAPGGDWPHGQRDALVAALLDAGAA
ncbi:hypothetical protein, partial [Falsiroseomonas oryzae]|uniref:hypothetical protein n=1 Tax=Falsiroseomonas oryzae TaxID=2766473 RepID=UPI0022EB3AAC